MASKRDRLKMLNQATSETKAKEKPTTIVDELIQNYEKAEEKGSKEKEVIANETAPVVNVVPTTPVMPVAPSRLINVIDKSNLGRPKAWQPGTYKDISARLKIENYEHARIVGGVYGGVTAYINWLIEEDIRRKNNKK